MIRYTLKCADGHSFESWFQSADATQSLIAKGLVACPECGSLKVEKSLMAPAVQAAKRGALAPAPTAAPNPGPASKTAALAALRREIEANSDYVGLNFAAEARAMHDGDTPSRAIYGEARLDEARKLMEDGVPVAPLPFRPTRKVN